MAWKPLGVKGGSKGGNDAQVKEWHVHLPRWHPARLNQWDGRHWAVRAKAKRFDRDLVAACVTGAGVPKATGKRRVSLTITLGYRQRGADPDAYWKSTLDALVHCGALVNDSRQWVELGEVEYVRGTVPATTISLKEVKDGKGDTPGARTPGNHRGKLKRRAAEPAGSPLRPVAAGRAPRRRRGPGPGKSAVRGRQLEANLPRGAY